MSGRLLVKNDRILFGLTIVLLVFLGFGFYTLVYLPQRAELRTRQQLYFKRQAEMEFMERFMVQHPDTATYEKRLLAELDDVRMRLPEALDISEILTTLQLAAKENDVMIKGVLPEKPVAKDKYVVQDIRIELNGRYQKVMEFFSVVEKQKRFCSINGMTLKSNPDGDISISLNMRLYALAAE